MLGRLPALSRLGLTARVFVATAAIVVVVLAAALAIVSVTARRAADVAARRGLEQATDLAAQFLTGRARSLSGGARVFVQSPVFRSIVAERQHENILDQAIEAAGQLQADWVFVTDDRGVLLAKSDEPGAADEPLGRFPLVAGALEGRVMSGFGVSRDTLLFQTVAVPIVVPLPHSAPIGVLVAAKVVDTPLARDVGSAAAADVVLYTQDAAGRPHVAATTLPGSVLGAGGREGLAARIAALARRRDALEHTAARLEIGGVPYDANGAAVTTAGGEVVGGFVLLRRADAQPTGTVGVRWSLFAAGALGLGLALLAAYGAARRVTRPVRALALAARRAADGDYEPAGVLAAAEGARGDEIGALAGAFAAMLADLRGKQALVALLGGPAPREGRAASPVASPAAGSADGRVPLAIVRAGPPTAPGRSGRAGRGSQVAPDAHPAAEPRPDARPEPGHVFADRYLVERVVGAGGMGVVYKAADLRLGESVAVKVLRPDVLAADPRAVERFTNELRLARRISHRNVVRLHDLGEHQGVTFITMEYVEGSSLAAMLRARGALPPAAALGVAQQLCRALEVAHEQGVVHGDLKPQNLLVGVDGVLKVTDFGVARLVRRSGTAGGGPADIAGAVVGTPEYMAPEQLLGRDAGVRGDIYAAGVVLHECLTGSTPFGADTPLAFFASKLDTPAAGHPVPDRVHGERAEPRVPSPPETLAELVARMTAADPDERPASAAELSELLARVA